MNKIYFIFLFIIVSSVFYSCKKSSAAPSKTTSTWTIYGTTYKADTTYFDTNNLNIIATDSAGTSVAIIDFKSRPTANGNFTPINAGSITNSSDLTSTQCVVVVSNNNNSEDFASTGTGGTVSVTISAGKINATFSNVKVEGYFSDSTTVSGSLHEQ